MLKTSPFWVCILVGMLIFTHPNTADVSLYQEGDMCNNPDYFVEITADPEGTGSLVYDTNEVFVGSYSCVQLKFVNNGDIEHDLTIDDFYGVSINLYLASKDDNGGTKSINIETHEGNREFIFYCSIPGHRDSGMEGSIYVEELTYVSTTTVVAIGNRIIPAPSVYLVFSSMVIIVFFIRRRD